MLWMYKNYAQILPDNFHDRKPRGALPYPALDQSLFLYHLPGKLISGSRIK